MLHVRGFVFRVLGFRGTGFQVLVSWFSGFTFGVRGFQGFASVVFSVLRFGVSRSGFRVRGFCSSGVQGFHGSRFLGSVFRVRSFWVFEVRGFGFVDSRFGVFEVRCFRFRVSGSGFGSFGVLGFA